MAFLTLTWADLVTDAEPVEGGPPFPWEYSALASRLAQGKATIPLTLL